MVSYKRTNGELQNCLTQMLHNTPLFLWLPTGTEEREAERLLANLFQTRQNTISIFELFILFYFIFYIKTSTHEILIIFKFQIQKLLPDQSI